jgi:hypothetical protein
MSPHLKTKPAGTYFKLATKDRNARSRPAQEKSAFNLVAKSTRKRLNYLRIRTGSSFSSCEIAVLKPRSNKNKLMCVMNSKELLWEKS